MYVKYIFAIVFCTYNENICYIYFTYILKYIFVVWAIELDSLKKFGY